MDDTLATACAEATLPKAPKFFDNEAHVRVPNSSIPLTFGLWAPPTFAELGLNRVLSNVRYCYPIVTNFGNLTTAMPVPTPTPPQPNSFASPVACSQFPIGPASLSRSVSVPAYLNQVEWVNNGFGYKNPLARCTQEFWKAEAVNCFADKEGDKSFSCRICKALMNSKHAMLKHLMTHEIEKRFKCTVCGKGFNEKFGLRRHTRVHTGIKPFKCELCPQACSQRVSLESHRRLVHGLPPSDTYGDRRNRIFVCEDCGFTCDQKVILDAHVQTLHPLVQAEFYQCVEESAIFVAKEILKSQSFIKKIEMDDRTLTYLTFNRNQFERIVKDTLMIHQFRVELYKYTGRAQSWELQCKATPGNVTEFEDVLCTYSDIQNVNRVVAFVVQASSGRQPLVAMACCELLTHTFRVCEIVDNDHFTNLQCALMQITPKECISPQTSSGLSASLESALQLIAIPYTMVKPDHFDSSHLFDHLNTLLKFKKGSEQRCEALPETNMKEPMRCVAALIKYLGLMDCNSNVHQFHLETLDLGQHLRLDCSSFNSLGLFNSTGVKGSTTLFDVLNLCQTACGERLLEQYIKMPLLSKAKIDERLDLVEQFVLDAMLRNHVRQELLCRFPDLHKMSKQFLRKRAGLADVYKIYCAALCLPKFVDSLGHLQRVAVVVENFIHPLRVLLGEFKNLLQMVETTVDLQHWAQSREFRIRHDFDERLQKLHCDLEKLKSDADHCLQETADSLNLPALKIEWDDGIGYHYRIRSNKSFRNVDQVKVIDVVKGNVRFTNKSLEKINPVALALKEEYKESQQKTIDAVVEITVGYMEPIIRYANLIGHLDVVVALSCAAVNAPVAYVRPTILDIGSGRIEISQGRHPFLECQEEVSFISNDLKLVKGDTELMVLTGPNMGGKSTYLRQAGIIVIMAQMGSFVPADQATISIVDTIMTRIGAADNLCKGLSTFMVEMIEAAKILQTATANSLLLVDELGRGTSTFDGLSLSWAIAEEIARRHCGFCLFATHFHELNLLATQVETVKNFHVTATFKGARLVLLYRVRPGLCNKSYGVEVAKMVDFPEQVVLDALDEEKRLNLYAVNDEQCLAMRQLLKDIKSELHSNDHADEVMPCVDAVEELLDMRFDADKA